MKKYDLITFILICLFLIPFSLGATLNGSSSIYTFNVTNCQADDYLVNCSPQTIRFQCDITNSAFIDFTEFRIDSVLYNASKVGQTWHFDFLKLNQTSTVNTTIVFDRIYITDTNSDTAVFDENVSVVHDCVTCSDVGFLESCSLNDSTIDHHIFEPTGCDVDFNESVVCDYCIQDLQEVIGDCQLDDTQNVTYFDANYFSCCAITDLVGDCSILISPFNETGVQNCSFLTQNFSCMIPSLAELKDEIPFSCLMPDNNNYKCVVNVFEDGRLLQTNPQQVAYNTGLIGSKRIETREFFTPSNSILNAYFTDKNLLTEKEFRVDVVCSDGSSVLTSQNLVTPFYNTASGVLNRVNWAKDNIGYLMVILVIVILAVGLLAFFYWQFKRRGG